RHPGGGGHLLAPLGLRDSTAIWTANVHIDIFTCLSDIDLCLPACQILICGLWRKVVCLAPVEGLKAAKTYADKSVYL
ncbi:MAG: hypothetical protein J2P52_08360, partial [Blastocatellia bacterium]|nr:hypothetical protein [Blastocatellia bacterium]